MQHDPSYVLALLRERAALIATGQAGRADEVDAELAKHGHQIETASLPAPETTTRPKAARKKAQS